MPVGRKRKPARERRSKVVAVNLAPAEWAAVAKRAALQKRALSDFAREAILSTIGWRNP